MNRYCTIESLLNSPSDKVRIHPREPQPDGETGSDWPDFLRLTIIHENGTASGPPPSIATFCRPSRWTATPRPLPDSIANINSTPESKSGWQKTKSPCWRPVRIPGTGNTRNPHSGRRTGRGHTGKRPGMAPGPVRRHSRPSRSHANRATQPGPEKPRGPRQLRRRTPDPPETRAPPKPQSFACNPGQAMRTATNPGRQREKSNARRNYETRSYGDQMEFIGLRKLREQQRHRQFVKRSTRWPI